MLILVVILYALFGLSFTLGKLMLTHAAPFFIIAARMIVGGICLLAYSYFHKEIDCKPKRENFWLHVQTIVFGIYLFYSLRSWGLQYVTTTKAALLCNLMPFFTALFSFWHFKERFTAHHIVGLIIGFVGTIPLLFSDSPYEMLAGGIGRISWPECAILIAVAALSYNVISMQKLVKHRQCSPALANGICMLFGGLMALGTSLMLEPVWIRPEGNIQTLLLQMGAQILISNLICSNLHATLLRHYSATFMSFASFLSPLCTIIYGYLWLNEKTSINFFASFFMVITGLFIYHFSDVKKSRNVTIT